VNSSNYDETYNIYPTRSELATGRSSENKYSMNYGSNSDLQTKGYCYRNMEKRDGWDSPLAWIER